MTAVADEEPNNTFPQAESIKDGTINGNVTAFGGYDVDIFSIDVHKNEEVIISVAIIHGGHLSILGFANEGESLSNFSLNIDGIGTHDDLKWKNCKGIDVLYIMITGNSVYKIKVETSMNAIQGFFADYTRETYILLGVIIVLIIIFGVAARVFLKTINLTISHGFEEKEKKVNYKNKKKVTLTDKKSRYMNMPITRDNNGIERMMHHNDIEKLTKSEKTMNKEMLTMDDYMDSYYRRKKFYEKQTNELDEVNIKNNRKITISERLETLKKENDKIKEDLITNKGIDKNKLNFEDENFFEQMHNQWKMDMEKMEQLVTE
jgi:hypothetical protein